MQPSVSHQMGWPTGRPEIRPPWPQSKDETRRSGTQPIGWKGQALRQVAGRRRLASRRTCISRPRCPAGAHRSSGSAGVVRRPAPLFDRLRAMLPWRLSSATASRNPGTPRPDQLLSARRTSVAHRMGTGWTLPLRCRLLGRRTSRVAGPPCRPTAGVGRPCRPFDSGNSGRHIAGLRLPSSG